MRKRNVNVAVVFSVMALVFGLGSSPSMGAAAEGISAGERLCQNIGFSSDVVKCMEVVTESKHLAAGAVQLCEDMGFSSAKLSCLQTIQNKVYTDAVITSCKGMGFASKIQECLQRLGKAYVEAAPVVPPVVIGRPTPSEDRHLGGRKVRREVRRAVESMERGNYSDAHIILKDLLIRLDEG